MRRSWQSTAFAAFLLAMASTPALAQCEPRLNDMDSPGGNAQAIAVEDDRLYVGIGSSGVAAYHIWSELGGLEPLGTFATTSFAEDVHAEGSLVFVANGWNGIQLIDYSTDNSGEDAGSANVGGFARSVEANGSTAFLGTDQPDRLDVFDISTLPFVNHIGGLDLPGTPWDLLLMGDVLFAACDGAGVIVVDVSTPSAPSIIGQVVTPGEAEGLSLEGSLLAVAAEFSGLQLLDVSDPANPLILGSHDTPNEAHGVVLQGSVAVIADDLSGIHLFDVSNPESPILLGSLDTSGEADDVGLFQCAILLADGANGVLAINGSECLAQCTEDCLPDLNGDGVVNTQDVFHFLDLWVTRDPQADWDSDGQINSHDFMVFLNDWVAGC